VKVICYANNKNSYALQAFPALLQQEIQLTQIFSESKNSFQFLNMASQNVPKPNTALNRARAIYRIKKACKKNAAKFFTDSLALLHKSEFSQYLFLDNITELKQIKFTQKKIAFAQNVFVAEQFIADYLIAHNICAANKIVLVYYKLQLPVQEPDADFKMQLTNDAEYFLYDSKGGTAQQHLFVLKAYSQFKKWQKSSMKLVIISNLAAPKKLVPNFENYRHKADVFFAEPNQQTIAIAEAYAAISFSKYSKNSFAMQCLQYNVPCIIADNEINRSVFGNAVLFSMLDQQELSRQIQLLYTNENMAASLRFNGSQLLQKYNDIDAMAILAAQLKS
jgi:hypothetical protein